MNKKILSLLVSTIMLFAMSAVAFSETPATEAEAPATEAEAPAIEAEAIVTAETFASTKKISIDGNVVQFGDVGPQEIYVGTNGGTRLLVPVRKLAELFNCTVGWRASDKTVHIFSDGKSRMLTVGKKEIVVRDFVIEGQMKYTSEESIITLADATPMIVDGRTLIPIRAMEQIFGVKFAEYVNDETPIEITVPEQMKTYAPTIKDRKARSMVEDYNYYPQYVPQTATVNVIILFNSPEITSSAYENLTVTINGVTQNATGGKCAFTDVPAGTYAVTVGGTIPEGFAAEAATVTVAPGATETVKVTYTKAAAPAEAEIPAE